MKYENRKSFMNDLLLYTVKKISDIEYQRKLWIEGSIPGKMDCWEETMCMFFDSANIDEFLKDMTPDSDPEFGLSAHQIEELWKLRNIITRVMFKR